MMKNTPDDTIYFYDLEEDHLIVADGTIEGTEKDELFTVRMSILGHLHITKEPAFTLWLDEVMEQDCSIRGFKWF